MTAVAMIGPKFHAWDANGDPLAGGKLYTYLTGTNTNKPTYQSENMLVENTNPVILNGEGYADVYLKGSYKIVLKDSEDNEVWSSDPVSSASAEEWVNCLSATYISTGSFKVAGNYTSEYDVGRRVRVDNDVAEYSYSTIASSVYSAGETTVTLTSPIVTTGIVGACVSIVGQNSMSIDGVYNFSVLQDAIDATYLEEGNTLDIKERTSGNGGGAMWDVVLASSVTPNTYTIVQCVGAPTLALVLRADGNINIKAAGAVGDGVNDDLGAIQHSINTLNESGGGEIYYPEGVYSVSNTVVPKALVVNKAQFGTVILRLANDSDTMLIESYLFSTLYASNAYQISDDADMTLDYGFDGFILDCNGTNQTTQPYGVKMYGRRLVLKNSVIADSKGVSLWTALKGDHSGGYDYTKTKTPGDIDELEIVNSKEEAWIFEGPSDQNIGHIVTNEVGDQDNDGSTPQTSTHFPGEQVHGVRVETAMHVNSMNLNGARFGKNLYINERFTAGRIILAGGWGNLWADTGAWGAINQLNTGANPYAWGAGSVVYPSVLVESDDLTIAEATVRRVSGQDQTTAPLIKDSGGANWGLVRNRQALTELGVFFEADAPGININLMNAKGADTALLTNSTCSRINVKCEFDNCNTVWDNDATDIRGAWDLTGNLSAGQVFSSGLDAIPNADEESLSNARIEFYDADTAAWKSNSARLVGLWDSTVTGPQNVVMPHGMWRAPKAEEIQLTARHSSWTNESEGLTMVINSFDSTNITARVEVSIPATGTPVDQVLARVN